MLKFRDRPISQKVTIITMVITAAALLLAGLGIVVADSVLFRQSLRRDLSALGRIVADNSTAALDFNDPDSAAQTLSALRARSHVDAACIYWNNGVLLAKYLRQPDSVCPPPEARPSARTGGNKITLAQPILLHGKRIGTLMLVYDLGEIQERIRLYGTTVACVLLAASLLAFLLSSHLRRLIAEPISRLVSATTSVSKTGDYGVRAQKLSGDEMGVLVDRFNEMLAGIQSRDSELKKALADREAALQEAEDERQRFRFMAESMPQKIFAASATGESVYLNKLWMDFTGLTFDQIRDWGLGAIHSSRRSGGRYARLAAEHRYGRTLADDQPIPPRRWRL